ncbi:membrane protein [Intrasporangium oryzae NRRL B-24470]|uniref:Membrane protein n=1 Tax=Intrasporangium oryzae NRRL B-24470 TaxID=1386089 RepID=W9G2N5_9MICO|nr:DUF4389 domain-containing protein [Intrasporangium oryzae]EWT00386.1 membrane protein [Intrasporangium oryzae NRRL B-24470]
MRTRHVIALIVGCLVLLPGLGLLLGGGAVGIASLAARDADGWYSLHLDRLDSTGVAVTAENVVFVLDAPETVIDPLDLQVRLRARSLDATKPIFIGIAPDAELAAYLTGAAHDQVTSTGLRGNPTYTSMPGSTTVAPPGEQDIWEARTSGPGVQELTWTAHTGRWAVAVLNADGSAGVAVDLTASVRSPILGPALAASIILGFFLTGLAVALIIIAVRGRSRGLPGPTGPPDALPPTGAPYAAGPVTEPASSQHLSSEPLAYQPLAYQGDSGTSVWHFPGPPAYGVAMPTQEDPVVLEARLDPALSRWRWLVKWLLAVPHLVLLVFLWLAFGALTVCAWFAILVTGRYPRSLFDFNVGVLRWTWRVAYYAGNGGLGTDRYPPFTLDALPEDDARLDIAYPPRLSRGLVFVKWLLLVPHWIVLAILIGSAATSSNPRSSEWRGPTWPGVLGLIALVAGLVLLFSGTYPKGVFDIVVGLNRWVYRVVAYAALMTDVYPPFRLDQGGCVTPTEGPGDGSGGSHGGFGHGFGHGFGGDRPSHGPRSRPPAGTDEVPAERAGAAPPR